MDSLRHLPLEVSPVSRPNYAGRHRTDRLAAQTPSRLARIAGAGLLLPTAAAATLVLTATGAHLGSISGTTAGSPAPTPTAVQSQTQSLLDRRREAQDLRTGALAALSRPVQDRAARDSERQKLDTVALDNARRAAEEQARQATAQVEQTAPALAAPATAPAAPLPAPASPAPAPAAAAPAAPATAPAPDTRGWVAPISAGYTLTSGFGMRWGALHPGQDFAIPVGSEVRAMSSGTVLMAGSSGGYGNKVEIQYWDGTVSWYAHNASLSVSQGQSVSPGQVVALSGNSGHSTGPHLHLEIHPANGDPVAPLGWLQKMGIVP